MLNRLQHLALTLFVAGAFSTDSGAQNWARFRGPSGQGHGGSQTLPDELAPEDVNWRVELPGSGHSSPVIWGDRVFVTAYDAAASACVVVCLDTSDGSEVWAHGLDVESYGMHDLNSFASATPVVDAEVVALCWKSAGSLRAAAFDHVGELLWERSLGECGAEHGGGASPALFDGVLLIANDTENADSFLVGLDAKSGDLRWKRERKTSRASFASPLVHVAPDGEGARVAQAIFASTAHGITSLDPRSGELFWERAGLFRPRCVASPAIAGQVLFATAGSGGAGKVGVALDMGRRGEAGVPGEAYRVQRGLPYVPCPVANEDRLFLWGDGGVVSCLELETGEEVWRERAGGTFYGSPILVDGKLLAMDTAGELVMLRAGDEFEVVCRLDLGEGSHATPAMAGGRLYLRTVGHLVSVGGSGDGE